MAVAKESPVVASVKRKLPYTKQLINLHNLELDADNFRIRLLIGKKRDQKSALSAMLNSKTAKLDGIAKSIVGLGLYDLETPAVIPSGNKDKYIVVEGNRRLTVLKALKTPELAKDSILSIVLN